MAISFLLVAFFLHSFVPLTVGQQQNSSTYIVHVHLPPNSATVSSFESRKKWHESFLPTSPTSSGEPRLIYSYSEIISGFAARLTETELAEMTKKEGFLHAYLDRILPLKTTHSPTFLGLKRDAPGFWKSAKYGKGVIIGIVDTGVSPSHPSFNDEGMPPPPSKWKGACKFNSSKECNNKLIGARVFLNGSMAMQGGESSSSTTTWQSSTTTPYDEAGHGTHTASTAGGMFVDGANINGLANGTASGAAPYAHLAIYRVCLLSGCADSDILAGMDSALNDGVDILSLSLGGYSLPFFDDSMAIGAFGAMEKGVFVSCAAGNSGPYETSLSNEAPWILTVGASTMDRALRVTIKLGEGKDAASFSGQTAYQPRNFSSAPLPLVYPGFHGGPEASFCESGSLDDINVRGKIVVCDMTNPAIQGRVVKGAGGVGMIVVNDQASAFTTFAVAYVLPAAHVSYSDGILIKAFAISATAPTASILFNRTLIGTTPAPAVAAFSSRGPSYADQNILKPDIIGPGVNVLAAWPFKVGGSGTYFNMISGTSMSTPHLSGIAALLKSTHPHWSPAAIKSAIMTTATKIGNDGKPIVDEKTLAPAHLFAMGAGHVDPSEANNPGLIYDIKSQDYIRYLCGLPYYTNNKVSAIARRNVTCSDVRVLPPKDLNYPSFTVFFNSSGNSTVTATRTVTNVGAPRSSYTVQVAMENQVKVLVKPARLSFSGANKEAKYSVVFTNSGGVGGKVYQGHLTWVSTDKKTTVSSPLLVVVGWI